MIVDASERQEALDPTRSFIIEAPAGSGKTGLLVQRFLRLLAVVDRPESVVAITFTRKAAAEMRERVVRALTEEAHTEDGFRKATRDLALAVIERDRLKSWQLLSDPGRLQIQTIDSLSALITRQMPVLSTYGGFGEVVEEASELYLQAAREMLMRLAEGNEQDQAVFRRMVLHFDNDVPQLERQVVQMLGKRDQWEHLAPLFDAGLVDDCCAMLRRAEEQLRLVFQRAGKVDFTEIARAARLALGKPDQPSDLLYSLDYRLQHLLVDEFQDTSRSQFNLIKALTEQWSVGDDHTLFLVGDPMQSIYRFREADVSLFLQCWQESRLGGVQLIAVKLKTNFRTTHGILDWAHLQFAPMMTEDNREKGAVQFRESVAGRESQGVQPRLLAHVKDDSGAEEAAEIVRIILANPERKVAILVRSRPQTSHILPALRKAGITYEAVDIETLRDQQHVIDVLALTRAITNLADRVSWLACLRAPWCGLTLADLSALAEGKRDQTIFDLLSDPDVIARLSVDGRFRAARVQEILSEAVAKVGRVGLRKLTEQTWQLLGGLSVIPEANRREDVQNLLRLIEDSEEGGTIRDFALLNRRLEFLYARPAVTECNVVIMTVYQAKGLEFDIVILPCIGRGVRDIENELLFWADVGDELFVAVKPQTGEKTPEYQRIKDILEEKEQNEVKRLFYVACTRAVNELHLIGSVGLKKDRTVVKPRTGTFLRLIWDNVMPEFESLARRRFNVAAALSVNATGKSILCRLPVHWQAPVMAKPVESAAPIRSGVPSQRSVSYRWVSDNSRHAGTVVHEMLSRIAADGLDKWSDSRINSMRGFVGSELLRLGVPVEEKRAVADQVLKAVSRTLLSDRGRWILSPHPGAKSEWAIAGRVQDRLVSGTIDRVFQEESGTYWIIDFKNSEHVGAGRDVFLANQKLRYQPQLEQYAAVVSSLVNAPISLGLYFPLLDGWVEWQFSRKTLEAVN